jgi:AcrR family transcriptional regulator
MVVFAGQGDPRRSMALLWRTNGEPPTRTAPGPKPGLSVDLIVDTAIEIADQDGMAALSMRAVGERLGRTGMALYTYVPRKTELIDLMYDRALGELATEVDLSHGWRAAVTAWAHDWREFSLRHPWTLQVSQARPVFGPNEYRALDTAARVLFEIGPQTAQLRRIFNALLTFIRGSAQSIAESRQAATETGVSDEEWWGVRSAELAEVAPDFADRFPMATRLNTEDRFRPNGSENMTYLDYLEAEAKKSFELGLGMILDGIEADHRLRSRARKAAR